MTLNRRIAFAVMAGWINRFISVALSFVFARVLYAHMTLEEQGLWILLGSSGAFVSLLDLGFSATFIRRIALARGKSGADAHAVLTEDTKREMAELITTGGRVYHIMAFIVFLTSAALGIYYLSGIELHHISLQRVWLAWIILCGGYAFNVWAQMWLCVISGLGLVGLNIIVGTALSLATTVVQLMLVIYGGGILELAIVTVVAGLVGYFTWIIIMRKVHPEVFAIRGRWSTPLFHSMTSPALRSWFTSLGAFLILKTDQYFIMWYLGANKLPDYNYTTQLVSNVYIFAVSIAAGSQVYISQLWQAGQLAQVHAHAKRSIRLGMILMVCGVAWLAVAGKPFIDLWLHPGHFAGYPILWTFCAMLTLEAHHVMVVTNSRATEDEAFAVIAMVAGVLNLVFTYILMKVMMASGNGLWGIALGTFFAQVLTNNWYAVYRGLRRLKMSIREHIREVLLPTGVVFILALGMGILAVRAVEPMGSNLVTLLASAGATGVVMAAALWFRGLNTAQREKIVRRLSRRQLETVK
jgi:O-antigen/teichoic acid export membrane protein